MGVEEVTNLLVNNGVAVGCLIYFMVYNAKQLQALNSTLDSLKDAINTMQTNCKYNGR